MLVRTFGYAPTRQLASDFDRLVGSVLAGSPLFTTPSTARPAFPALNAWEDDKALYVEAEVPGVPLDHLEITVEGEELTIKGQRPAPASESLRQERWHGSFERTITLPVAIETEAIDASLVNGVLTVTLPKAASARARKIEIKPALR